jgi:hypothetical protein
MQMLRSGLVRTELWREFPADVRDELFRTHGGVLPVGRVGEASDLARSYLHLWSTRLAPSSP